MKLATPEVLAAVEDLYRVFAIYPLPGWTDPCLHCHSENEERQLRAFPLRELGSEQLRYYAGDALLVWGDEATFKHFLPRLFELYVTVSQPSLELTDPEILFSKFRHGKWHLWPEEEINAVRRLTHAIWHAVLENQPDPDDAPYDIDCYLCSIAQAEDDLEPYLQEWLMGDDLERCFALSSFLLASSGNAFWEGRDVPYQQLKNWLRSEQVRQKLSWAIRRVYAPELKEEFKAALATLSQPAPSAR
jgi:hypothetical protein